MRATALCLHLAFRLGFAALLATHLANPLAAGIGPENVVVVVNADSWASLAIANEYVHLRDIPPSHVIFLNDIPTYETIGVEDFRTRLLGPVLETIRARGLSEQIDCIAWSADFPYAIDVSADIKAAGVTPPKVQTPIASLNGLAYLHEQVMAKDPGYLDLGANRYMRRPIGPADSKPPTNEEIVAIREANELITQKKWTEAAERFTKLTEQRPQAALLHYNLACCLARLEKSDEAIAALRKAVDAGWWNRNHAEKDEDLAALRGRDDFQSLLAEMQSPLFDVQPTTGFRSRDRWSPAGERVESGGRGYLLSMMLAVTSGRGTSVETALEGLRRSAAADGTRPAGTVYFLKNGDIRSKTRERAFRAAAEQLRKRGVAAEILNGVLPREKPDVAGAVIGIAGFDWAASGSRILPGAICEHLTSFGGVMRERAGQTPLSEFLRHGAAAASGTVTEPYAIQAKFPFPFLHVHYAAGCTAAEAFYQSVHGPYQLLIVGDPLCRPWAKIPRVTFTGLAGTIDGDARVSIKPTVVQYDGPIARFELFLDGIRRGTCAPSESLEFETRSLDPGPHRVTVVAVAEDGVETIGRASAPFRLVRGAPSVRLESMPSGRVRWNERLQFRAACPGAESLVLRQKSRVLATWNGDSGEAEIDPRQLGLGTVEVEAVATFSDGKVFSELVRLEVLASEPLPAAVINENEATVPGLLLRVDGNDDAQVIEQTADGKWLAHLDSDNPSRAQLTAEFEAETTGLHQFQIRGNAKVDVAIDGQTIGSHNGSGWTYLPVPLAAGRHRLRLELQFESKPDLQIRFGLEGTESLGAPRFRHTPVKPTE